MISSQVKMRPNIPAIWGIICTLCIGLVFVAESSAQAIEGRWQVLPEGPEAIGRHDDVVFINENEGWVVNLSGEIHGTKDGGTTWELLHSDLFLQYRSTVFVNDRIGFVGSLNAGRVLFQTFDGGRNWINLTSRIKGTAPQSICGLWAVDEKTIFGVGAYFGGPWFVKSEDGGLTWTSKVVGAGAKYLVEVYFKNKNEGYAVGGTSDLGD
ncbi:MAG: YCF48-related protein, partial [Bacteroidetes bacterium]|nr:YCF48-related protein [Bacteroidota bacterium]